MNNQWKLVPVDATRAMIDAAAKVEEDGYDAMHKAMLAAAPVPPVGDVEVQCSVPGHSWPAVSEPKVIAYVDESDVVVVIGESAWRRKAYVDVGRAIPDAWVKLVDRAHVTRLETEVAVQYAKRVESVQEVDRLTAERDGLLARLEESTVDCEANRHEREVVCANYEVLKAERDELESYAAALREDFALQLARSNDYASKLSGADAKCNALQSELTKARELILKLANKGSQVTGFPSQLMREARVYLAHQSAPIAHNADESCGQDAEAAKCARCEASTVESCDEKGCGFLGAGNGAPAAKGGE